MRRFSWLASEGVGMHIDDMGGFEEVLVGAMTIQTYTKPVPQFQAYFESLTPENTRNPWFPLLWSELFACTWNISSDLSNVTHCNSTLASRIPDSANYMPECTVSIILDSNCNSSTSKKKKKKKKKRTTTTTTTVQ